MATRGEPIIAAFAGHELVGRGSLAEVAARCKARLDTGEQQRIALYDDDSGKVVDVDFSGSEADVVARLSPSASPGAITESSNRRARRGPGRPRLGVVSREISLLPRHWQWLAEQRGTASATLRRLVDAARNSESGEAVARRAVDAAHRFLWDIAGDQPGFEEATRALFRRDFDRVEELTSRWPAGLRQQVARYLERARGAQP